MAVVVVSVDLILGQLTIIYILRIVLHSCISQSCIIIGMCCVMVMIHNCLLRLMSNGSQVFSTSI